MLQLIEIAKAYKTAGFTQVALDHVSVAFRDNEFVAVLGPSGSGKTTMLNILGGLDHADSGDIVINGVSTKHYADKDWDTYRNHRIGFIFQSYNLIPHQTVLSNVELALTLAGVGRTERRERAREALERVGLAEHVNKRPNQLSGGQMQRVAIARALVNDPDIVLADEPTGALDTETGIQVMNLLKEIAEERLIVMVTHNPELAEEYATRIVRLTDGRITSDTDPFDPDAPMNEGEEAIATPMSPTDSQPASPEPEFAAGADAEAGTESGLDSEADTVVGADPSVRSELVAESDDGLAAATEPAPIPRPGAELSAESELAVGADAEAGTESGLDAETIITAGAEPMAGIEPDVETEDGFATVVESEPAFDADIEADDGLAAAAESGAELSAESELVPGADAEAGAGSGLDSEADAVVDAESEPASGADAGANDGFAPATEVVAPLPVGSTVSAAGPDATAHPSSAPARRKGTARVDKGSRKASMSFFTALALSFNNLMTKKGRTFMTAFAGSIGIIGIAAILSLSNGVNAYIADTEEEALSSYPLTITKSSFDITNLLMVGSAVGSNPEAAQAAKAEAAPGEDPMKRVLPQNTIMTDMFAQVKSNDLSSFKSFLESGESGMEPYINHIRYSYGVTPLVYKADTSKEIVKLNPSYMSSTLTNGIMGSALTGGTTMSSFNELMDNERMLHQQMDLVAGKWPESYDECVVVLNRSGGLSDYTLYSLGFYDTKAMEDMTNKALSGEEVVVPDVEEDFTIGDALGLRFKVVPSSSLYQKNAEQGTWTDMTGDKEYMRKAIADGIELKVVGIIQRSETASSSMLTEGIAYTPELTKHLMQLAAESDIVKEQKADPKVDVFTGSTFEDLAEGAAEQFDMESLFKVDEDKIQEAFSFDTSALEGMGGGIDLSGIDMSSLAGGFDLSNMSVDPSAFSSTLDEQAFARIMEGAPSFDVDSIVTSDAFAGLSQEQQLQLTTATDQLASGFMTWYVTPVEMGGHGGNMADFAAGGMSEAFALYLQTPAAQAIVAPLGEQFAQQAQAAVDQAMTDYFTNSLGPYLASSISALMTQAAQAMVAQLGQQLQTQMAAATQQLGSQLSSTISNQLSGQMDKVSSAMEDAFSFDADVFAEAIQINMSQEDLASLLSNYLNAEELSYDNNLKKLGYATEENPESISIYPIDFPAKEKVLEVIDDYNADMEAAGEEDQVIEYSDFAGALMGSVTDIVNTISLVLIAFVSISLVVSSIMISIITYISVLERKKEIGILRAMGASKFNVANVFNAETIIEGLLAGIFAITVVYTASVPVNAFILETRQVPNIMQLPVQSALNLVGISVFLTLVAGIIPSSAAARRDPVEALRSE